MKTRKFILVCLALALCVAFLAAGCTMTEKKGEPASFGTFSKQFYAKNPVQADSLDKTWGEPVAVQALEGDLEKRIYLVENPLPGRGDAYRYFYVQNGMVVKSGMTGVVKLDKKSTRTTTLPAKAKSMAYWEKNPMSEEKVLKTWGKPIREMEVEGIKQLIFEVDNPVAGRGTAYRYFLILDGNVLAAGMTNTIGKQADVEGDAGDKIDNPMYNMSKMYYSKRTVTTEDIDKIWGTPIVTQKLHSGIEKRVYHVQGTVTKGYDDAYRYFLIKDGKVIASGIDQVITTDVGM